MNIRLPELSGVTDSEKLVKIQDFLYELVRNLNFALLDIDRDNAEVSFQGGVTSENRTEKASKEDADALFAELKPYIIKNADIIASYSEEINKKFKGLYVAQTEFAAYSEETDAEIVANSKNIQQFYQNIQTIEGSFAPGTDTAIVKTTNATITTGLVGYDEDGNAQYGMKIDTVTNDKTFASAKFLSTGVIIYDESGNEALIITDNTINVKNINASSSFILGGMRNVVSGSIITGKYVG